MKRTLSAVWVFVPLAVGVATQTDSPAGWVMLALATVIPPAILMYLWHEPVPTISEQIQEALR